MSLQILEKGTFGANWWCGRRIGLYPLIISDLCDHYVGHFVAIKLNRMGAGEGGVFCLTFVNQEASTWRWLSLKWAPTVEL